MRFYLYTVDVDYINFLREWDKKVPNVQNEKAKRPFIGVIICVNGKNYFAPLSSPKEKHKTMKNKQDFMLIAGGKYGAINFNNMIPIPRRYIDKIYLNTLTDNKYAKMLQYQLEWINSNKQKITTHARNLYYLIEEGTANANLTKRCCNFKLLEKKCYEYMYKNCVMEEELEYVYMCG